MAPANNSIRGLAAPGLPEIVELVMMKVPVRPVTLPAIHAS